MGYWSDLYTIAQNVIAQKGMNIDLHGEIAKSMSLMANLSTQMSMMEQNPMQMVANNGVGDTISPMEGQSTTEGEIMP